MKRVIRGRALKKPVLHLSSEILEEDVLELFDLDGFLEHLFHTNIKGILWLSALTELLILVILSFCDHQLQKQED